MINGINLNSLIGYVSSIGTSSGAVSITDTLKKPNDISEFSANLLNNIVNSNKLTTPQQKGIVRLAAFIDEFVEGDAADKLQRDLIALSSLIELTSKLAGDDVADLSSALTLYNYARIEIASSGVELSPNLAFEEFTQQFLGTGLSSALNQANELL